MAILKWSLLSDNDNNLFESMEEAVEYYLKEFISKKDESVLPAFITVCSHRWDGYCKEIVGVALPEWVAMKGLDTLAGRVRKKDERVKRVATVVGEPGWVRGKLNASYKKF